MMETGRKLVLFPTDQFFAIVGTIAMSELAAGPYSMTIADICNDKSSATHGARDHMHRTGRLYLTGTEIYSLHDNSQKVCTTLDTIHLPLENIRAIIDFCPEYFQGDPRKRQEQQERDLPKGRLRFSLHEHVLSGEAAEWDIYRLSEKFIGLSQLRVEELPARANLSLPGFLELIGCPQPDYMAVNLATVFHS